MTGQLSLSITPGRRQLLGLAVIEAARAAMAWHLRDERFNLAAGYRWVPSSEYLEAMQTLRDACAAERASRGAP